MATGIVNVFPGGVGPDNATASQSAALSYDASATAGSGNVPKSYAMKLLFDATTDEHWMFNLLLPADYASGGTLRGVAKFTSAVANAAIMKAGQVTTVDGSTDDDATSYAATDLSSSVTAPGTQGQTVSFTIALTTTNMAANRLCRLYIGREPDNASDTATGDLELLSLNLEYTTA